MSFPSPFKKLGLADGLDRRNLRQTARKASEIPGLFQRAIHSRRTDFQDIARTGHQLLHVQNYAQLLADPLAIRVTDLGEGVWRRTALGRFRRLRGGQPVDVHPQKALLTDLPFDIHDFQALRTCYPFGGFADLIQIHAKTPRPKPVTSSFPPAATKKWACAHSMVRPVSERRVSIFPQHGKSKVLRGLEA